MTTTTTTTIMVMRVILSQRITFKLGKVKLTVMRTMMGEFPEVLVGGVAEVDGMVLAEDIVEGID